MQNRRVLLQSRPTGVAQAENFSLDTAPVPAIADGEMLVRNHFLSVEPAMRGWIADAANYSAPVPLGSVMRALCAGTVIESRAPADSADSRTARFSTSVIPNGTPTMIRGRTKVRRL